MRNSLKLDGPVKTYLDENELPKAWYNVRADMKKKPAPLLNPGTGKPVTFEDLQPVFCDELIKQELDNDTAYFEIPEDILTFYKMYRPSPLVRAYFLEQALGTPAHIYYKFEGNNTSGSHKLNSAIAQAYYAKKQGLKGVTTETGAGQWGTALSMSTAFFGLDCQVYMVKVSYEQKPFRREVMRTYGASVTPSPSMTTEIGKKINAEFPGTTGSLGCAISEAVEAAVKQPGYRYVLGSVLNQVLLHQSVIGLETKAALDKLGVKADLIIGCAGGGSNLGGLISPFVGEKLRGEADYDILAIEPASCPSFTRGKYAYDFCDTGKVCPLAKMYTLGSSFIPSANHAGGLRYHGMSTILSELYDQKLIRAASVEQTKVFEAAKLFAQTEGILPAPESSHAIRATIDEALKCKESGEAKNIVFGLTGTGYFDMVAYQKFNDGEMSDYIPTDEDIAKSLAQLPKVQG
ncbi:MAG: TrpB-like pyridoxal phosphate-dependent enzyme [Fibrobacter sp.]|uniref:TrpB-like pyridoxal phosphate-dependent enzyme n=1 Tax=Fibrobacter sp. TaxID=35828 RepID=UPI0025C3C531|nr:TrpB-like pyridoxal phosphate-dependent enzyme [Fibrobacter sp.]MBQ9225495.1 TrpB-like pyridoxal phosphate-dependent enzyme [Fibrobacter sp.]MBR4008523.1 TrpB-like pyridoxal phosphate-dependent enzyme [Fibrobacter sp.]